MKAFLLAAAILLTNSAVAHAWSSKAAQTENQIKNLSLAIALFQSEVGRLPTQEGIFAELVAAHNWPDGESTLDDWKRPYQYRVPGKHGPFDLYSLGKDGIDDDGQRDDISNWAGVNEGYYWKSQWPGGRMMIRWGKIIGLASLFLCLFFPMRIVVPFAWAIIAFGYFAGNRMLLHPGIVPDYNAPLLKQSADAGLALLILLVIFMFNFRRYILRRRAPNPSV